MKKNRWIKTGADMVILLCSVILCVQIYFESHRLEQSLLIFYLLVFVFLIIVLSAFSCSSNNALPLSFPNSSIKNVFICFCCFIFIAIINFKLFGNIITI